MGKIDILCGLQSPDNPPIEPLTWGWSVRNSNSHYTPLTLNNMMCKNRATSISNGAAVSETVWSTSESNMRYFEILTTFPTSTSLDVGYSPGICHENLPANMAGTIPGQSANAIRYAPLGALYHNGSSVVGLTPYESSSIVRFWLLPSTGEIWVGLNDTFVGDPSLGTGSSFTLNTGSSNVYAAVCGCRRITASAFLRTLPNDFFYSSEGALGWDE